MRVTGLNFFGPSDILVKDNSRKREESQQQRQQQQLSGKRDSRI